ncbi:hypothetical protein GCM10007916_16720 [Psychromonas marina]|uniref:DUF523 domain-containing protein n=1 Tax=Psychromonas marina TaxID=88364 RepID=A0ABQ6E066_9GAMM|nr:DUF523 domain-containing protein [Psychromonas marina]GLS90605.1 hypothetical protein GCM10007916_16720 [Psychromonas marina]
MNNNTYKILISACLLGERVRYDAKQKKIDDPLIERWHSQGLLLPVCPEVLGGLTTPRPAAEIQINGSVKTNQDTDVTEAFQRGAEKTLALALKQQIKIVILTERSPSCGSSSIYDGNFSRTIIDGQGVTTKLLRDNGILVFNQFQLEQVQAQLDLL